MQLTNKILLFALVQLFFVTRSNAQSHKQRNEIGRVSKFFNDNFIKSKKRDTAMIFSFSFIVEVEKDLKGTAKVRSLTATDTLAFQLYPKYKFFETINYGVFMKDRKKATFVLPVFIQQYDSSYKEFKFEKPADKVKLLFPFDFYKRMDDITKYIFFPAYVSGIITKY